MKNLPKHTAILIFSRTAREEARTKQFGRHLSAAQNLRVAELMIQRSRRIARLTQLPVFTIGSGQQEGTTFGQRFTNAIARVFEEGFKHVIAIGTDCPALSPKMLIDAATQVANDHIVTGANHDGGIYLLGLSQHQFQRESLANIPWQSGQDFEQIEDYAQQGAYELFISTTLHDLDNAQDLIRVLNQLSSFSRFVRCLRQLLQVQKIALNTFTQLLGADLLITHFLRGPPSITSF